MTKRYTVKGSSLDVLSCDRCGRTELKSTVVLLDNVSDEIVHFGIDCAATVAGYAITQDDVRAADRAEADARFAVVQAEGARWESWLFDQTGETEVFSAIQKLGGFAAARAAYKAA
jgi:hypothetical protein